MSALAASSITFNPHGLITTPVLEYQYRRAHIENFVKGLHDVKEYETVKLLENIFNKVIFREMDDVFVNSQQPPGLHSRKACDIVIEYVASGSFMPKVLCFVECKRTKKTSDYSLKKVEKQALVYCKEYLRAYPDLEFVYACTACGAHLRLWKYSKGDEDMVGFWGNRSGGGYWEEYKDVGVDSDGNDILQSFQMMHAHAPEPRQGQGPSDYGSLYTEPYEQEGEVTGAAAENEDDEDDEDDDDEDDEEEEEEEEIAVNQAISHASGSGTGGWIWDDKYKKHRYWDGSKWVWS